LDFEESQLRGRRRRTRTDHSDREWGGDPTQSAGSGPPKPKARPNAFNTTTTTSPSGQELKNEEKSETCVVAVEMKRMWQREASIGIVFNEPVSPLVDRIDVDEVVRHRVRSVPFHDILGHGLLPVDVDCGAVDLPDEKRGGRRVEVDRDGIAGRPREPADRDGALDHGRQIENVTALEVGRARALVGWEPSRRVGVAEDGRGEKVVAAAAKVLATKSDVEPIVTRGGRAVNRHIEALANAEEDGLHRHGIDRDKVGSDNGHLMAHER